MGWQEELRRLDAELADGHITHDQHRRLRDELLASASGGAMPSPRASPLQRREDTTAPVWRSTNPGSETPRVPERAQEPPEPSEPAPVRPRPAPPERRPSSASALLETGRPTTAPSPADHRRTESLPHPLLDQPTQRLQPVPAMPPLLPPGRRMPPQSTPARTPASPRGQKPTWLFISLGVLLVLALIIGGAWWLGHAADGLPGGQESATSPTGALDDRVALEDRLPELPGRASPHDSTVSIDKGAELGFYTHDDAAFMAANGAERAIYRSSGEGDQLTDGNTLLVVEADSAENAGKVAQYMRGTVRKLGFTQETQTGNSPTVLIGSNSAGRLNVDWYVSGNFAVGIGVSQALDDDPNDLSRRLHQLLTSVERVLPRTR